MANVLEEYKQLRDSLVIDIGKVERVLSDLETQYHTAEYSQAGHVLKGYDGFLASKENLRKRARSYKPEDRLFSMSSRTSPALQARDMEGPVDGADGNVGLPAAKKPQYAQKGYAQKGYAQKQPKR